jgi:hypothetical protein
MGVLTWKRHDWAVVLGLGLGIALAARADVSSPVAVTIDVRDEQPDGGFVAALKVVVVGAPPNVAKISASAVCDGVLKGSGSAEWPIASLVAGRALEFSLGLRPVGWGEGSLTARAEAYDAQGKRLFGSADTLFVLRTPDSVLRGRSSVFELKRQKLELDRRNGKLTEAEYQSEFGKLMRGAELRFERELREAEKAKPTPARPPR